MSRTTTVTTPHEYTASAMAYDALTATLEEIKMLAEIVDSVEEGFIESSHASLLARVITAKVDAAYEHAKAVVNGGAK